MLVRETRRKVGRSAICSASHLCWRRWHDRGLNWCSPRSEDKSDRRNERGEGDDPALRSTNKNMPDVSGVIRSLAAARQVGHRCRPAHSAITQALRTTAIAARLRTANLARSMYGR